MKYKISWILFTILLGITCCYGIQSLQKCSSEENINFNFENAITRFRTCFNVSLQNFRHLVTSNTCKIDSHDVNYCDLSIQNSVSACHSNDTKYFPLQVLKIIKNYADYICKRALAYKFSIVLDHETCFPSLYHGIGCFEKFRFFNASSIVFQIDMCIDEMEVQSCLEEYARSYCPKDKVFPLIINQTFDYEAQPCRGNNCLENTILVIIASYSLLLTKCIYS